MKNMGRFGEKKCVMRGKKGHVGARMRVCHVASKLEDGAYVLLAD